MPLFENLFNRKIQAPENENSGGSGSSSFELPHALAVDQVWINKSGDQVVISCLDPLSVERRGSKRGTDFPELDALKQELLDGKFTVREDAPVKPAIPAPLVPADPVLDPAITFDPPVATPEPTPEPISPPKKDELSPAASPVEALFKELAPEREELIRMMDSYKKGLDLRIKRGWVTLEEEKEIKRALERSNIDTLPISENLSVDEARKRIERMKNSLPITRMRLWNEEGYNFFLKQEQGGESEKMIGQMLLDARVEFEGALAKEPGDPRVKRKFWRRNVLPQIERLVLQYMSEFIKHEDERVREKMSIGAFRIILSRVNVSKLNLVKENPDVKKNGAPSSEEQILVSAGNTSLELVQTRLKEARAKYGLSLPEAPASKILGELAPEREKLGKKMEKYDQEINDRVEKGWITLPEEERMRKAWEESDEMLHKVIEGFTQKTITVEEARKELKAVQETLPITMIFTENARSLQRFSSQEHGYEEAEGIENLLKDAYNKYLENFPPGNVPSYAISHWRINILPGLKDKILEYMDAFSQEADLVEKHRINRQAFNELLNNCCLS